MDAWVQARKATVHEMHILQRTTTDVFLAELVGPLYTHKAAAI